MEVFAAQCVAASVAISVAISAANLYSPVEASGRHRTVRSQCGGYRTSNGRRAALQGAPRRQDRSEEMNEKFSALYCNADPERIRCVRGCPLQSASVAAGRTDVLSRA